MIGLRHTDKKTGSGDVLGGYLVRNAVVVDEMGYSAFANQSARLRPLCIQHG